MVQAQRNRQGYIRAGGCALLHPPYLNLQIFLIFGTRPMPLKRTCCLLLGLLLCTAPAVQAERYLRIRLLQPQSEQGKYREGSTEGKLGTTGTGWMLSYGDFAVGQSTLTTSISLGDFQHKLISAWQEGAFIFGMTRTSSLTLGGGLLSAGKGTVTYSGTEYTSSSASGNSWFGLMGFEYILPITFDLIKFEYVEVLLGYRENRLSYGGYQSGSSTLGNSVKVKTVQYLLGLGLVF